ncbi:MAG: DoxX family protein [Verrucomicrobiota bacterium]
MNPNRFKSNLRILFAVLFVVAGIFHFTRTKFYAKMVPPYLPVPLVLVYVSGVFEIMGGIGLLIPRWRRIAGYGLIALLIAVFPANIQMLLQNLQKDGLSLFSWMLIARLPLQFVLILLVNWLAKDP